MRPDFFGFKLVYTNLNIIRYLTEGNFSTYENNGGYCYVYKHLSQELKLFDGKGSINVEIYSAIYFVVTMAIAMTVYIPVIMPLLCAIGLLVGRSGAAAIAAIF